MNTTTDYAKRVRQCVRPQEHNPMMTKQLMCAAVIAAWAVSDGRYRRRGPDTTLRHRDIR